MDARALRRSDFPSDLAFIKAAASRAGYRFEVDPDGTERCLRPDGTVAVIARPKPREKESVR
jgi:hypothetical protein